MSAIQGAGAPPPESDLRPLPTHPNLEFERKAAKKLLKLVLRGDQIALERLRAVRVTTQDPEARAQLADAQLTIAREYGFPSWPRLVEYFDRWNLHEKSQREIATYRPAHYEDDVRRTLAAHKSRRWWMAASAAAYVPRCYGKTDDEIFDTPLTESEIRHLVARREMFPNWEALIVAANRAATREAGAAFAETPFGRAQAAIDAEDLVALQAIVAEQPELLRPATDGFVRAMNGMPRNASIASSAVLHERKSRSAKSRELTDWLASQGADVQFALNAGLIGGMRATADDFEWLIARGADVSWLPPNGMSLIEHVLLRCWNPGPADVLRRYVQPRRGCWIAAGMNDVAQLGEYFSRDGSLTEAARNDRPDYVAAQMPMLQRPGVGDRDLLWEIGGVAIFNLRWEALDFLLARGFDIDYSPWRFNYLHWAVGNTILPAVEQLVKRGADCDLKGWHPFATAREMAASNLEDRPDDPEVQRVFEIVNGAT